MDNKNIQINGVAKNENLIQQFLANLEADGIFNSVHLGNVQTQNSLKNFSISSTLSKED